MEMGVEGARPALMAGKWEHLDILQPTTTSEHKPWASRAIYFCHIDSTRLGINIGRSVSVRIIPCG